MKVYRCNLLGCLLSYVTPYRNASKLLCFKDKLTQLSLTGTCPLSKVHGEEKWVKVSFSGVILGKVAPALRMYFFILC